MEGGLKTGAFRFRLEEANEASDEAGSSGEVFLANEGTKVAAFGLSLTF